jgi:hypothetical protein
VKSGKKQQSKSEVGRGEGKIAIECYSRENGVRSTGLCPRAWCYAPAFSAFSAEILHFLSLRSSAEVKHKFVLVSSVALKNSTFR